MTSLSGLSGAVAERVQKASMSALERLLGSARALSDTMPQNTMPSLRSMAKFALGSAQVALMPSYRTVDAGSPPDCPNPQLSCHNTSAVQNTCCFNAPGGQLLQTQFWDTSPPTGPVDHWTVHGLWFVRSFASRIFLCESFLPLT